MKGIEIKEILSEYIRDFDPEYAIMIDGEWGSGKTYFLVHTLPQIIKDNTPKKHYAYVSLYGMSSIEEVSKEIIIQYFGAKNSRIATTANSIIEMTASALTASLGAFNISLSSLKNILAKVNINNWLICFDDLERCCIPISEILGYINRLVEHNKCNVIIIANEKEIGKVNLNKNIEEKYNVVLSGKKLSYSEKLSKDVDKELLTVDELKDNVEKLFNEDILYKLTREKVIGLTIRYECDLDEVYDSIKEEYTDVYKSFYFYLEKNKSTILGYFKDHNCYNLRTLKITIKYIYKTYDKTANVLNTNDKYFYKIIDEFVEYIAKFMIYYKNGGQLNNMHSSAPIESVSFVHDIYSYTRGFRFLETYCTTLKFSEEDLKKEVATLKEDYQEKEQRAIKFGLATAYTDLANWWELDDRKVEELIKKLIEEVKEDKYPTYNYEGIIGQLLVLEYNGFKVGAFDEVIDAMNSHIKNTNGEIDFNRFGYKFNNNKELQLKYNAYINKLSQSIAEKEYSNKYNEINKLFDSDDWAEELYKYFDEHVNEYYTRHGFIDLIDIDRLLARMKLATPKQIYTVKKIFGKIYNVSNINEFFMDDRDMIIDLKNKLERYEFYWN